jgi:hypothetical protein
MWGEKKKDAPFLRRRRGSDAPNPGRKRSSQRAHQARRRLAARPLDDIAEPGGDDLVALDDALKGVSLRKEDPIQNDKAAHPNAKLNNADQRGPEHFGFVVFAAVHSGKDENKEQQIGRENLQHLAKLDECQEHLNPGKGEGKGPRPATNLYNGEHPDDEIDRVGNGIAPHGADRGFFCTSWGEKRLLQVFEAAQNFCMPGSRRPPALIGHDGDPLIG